MRHALALIGLGVSAGCVEITPPREPASLDVSPSVFTIMQNTSVKLGVVVLDSAGAVIDRPYVTYVSANSQVAVVAPGGTVYGAGPGTTTIEARAGAKRDTVTVTVVIAPVQSIVVFPQTPAILPGQTFQLQAQTRSASGSILTDRPVAWSSLNEFATVSSTGLVTGVAAGAALIKATSEGESATMRVNVIPKVLTYEVYKRGGTTTPGTATLTFGNDTRNGTLVMDGQTFTVQTATDSTGVYCFLGIPVGTIMSCGSRPAPRTIWLCTALNGLDQPYTLQYVLFPADASDRQPTTAAALLASIPVNAINESIEVHSQCGTSGPTPRWLRATAGNGFYLTPNTTTLRTNAEVEAMLAGALIFAAPGAGSDPRKYVALRIGAGTFELWH